MNESFEIIRNGLSRATEHAQGKRIMTFDEYQRAAMRTRGTFTSKREVLINAVLGISGEAGEVAGLVKKHIHQGHELNLDALIKEAGDVLWYLAELASISGVTLGTIAEVNIEKLKKRYPDGFSVDKSTNRKGE